MKPRERERERERVDKSRRGFFRLCAAYVGIDAFKNKAEADTFLVPNNGASDRCRTGCKIYPNQSPGSEGYHCWGSGGSHVHIKGTERIRGWTYVGMSGFVQQGQFYNVTRCYHTRTRRTREVCRYEGSGKAQNRVCRNEEYWAYE